MAKVYEITTADADLFILQNVEDITTWAENLNDADDFIVIKKIDMTEDEIASLPEGEP